MRKKNYKTMKSESKKKKNKQPTIYILDLSLFVKYFSNHYLCFFSIFSIIFMSLYLIKITPTIYMLHGLFNIFCHSIFS